MGDPTRVMNVLYPISLDNRTESISSKFREIVNHCQASDIHFYAGYKSQPASDIAKLWHRPNLSRSGALDVFQRRYDIVHNGRATATNLAVVAAARLRGAGHTKHIFTISIEPSPQRWNFRHAQLLTTMASVVIANSQAVADGAARYYHRVPDYIIPNGVDTDFFAPLAADATTRSHYRISEPYMLFVGTIEARKRPDLFVTLARKFPSIDFVMVGSIPQANHAALVDLPKNVKLLGLIPKHHVRDLLATSHALIFPSELEGLPNAVLEAVSMGLPVVAQPKSSLPEIIQDGVNGWLVDAQDFDLWVDLVRDLVAWSDERRQAFRDAARSLAVRTYSWSLYAERHVEVYRQLCGVG